MATQSTYTTIMSIILTWIDGEISPKAIQDVINAHLDSGQMWAENGQLISSLYNEEDIDDLLIDKMIDECVKDKRKLEESLLSFKKEYEELASIRNKQTTPNEIKEQILKCIIKNTTVRIHIAKQIARLAKKIFFLEEDIAPYTRFISKQIKFHQ